MNDQPRTPAPPLVALAQCLRFYSRLPIPRMPGETDPHALPDFAHVTRMLPVAGLLLGAIGGLALGVGLALGLPAPLAATLAVAATVASTGAFHEDGLADTADGFGGGATPARRLEIMTDSRIGTFGGAALVLSLIARVLLVAALVERAGWGATALALAAAGAVSRVAGLGLIWGLPNAKPDGKSAAVGRPSDRTMAAAALWAGVIGLVLLLPAYGPVRTVVALGLAAAVAIPLANLSRRMIGGQTGDVAGAVTQASEIVLLVALVARP